jgi:hypothetical protein
MASYELGAVFDNCKSFYGKARVETTSWGKALISYTTRVAEIIDGKAVVYGTYSATPLRHIRDFCCKTVLWRMARRRLSEII